MHSSRLPLLVPRQAIEAQVQPLAACDLGDAVAALLGEEAARQHGIVHLAGARPAPLAFIASLRVQAGAALRPCSPCPTGWACSAPAWAMPCLSPWCS